MQTLYEMVGNPDGDGFIKADGADELPVGTICEIHRNTNGSESYRFSTPGSPGHEAGGCCEAGQRYVLEDDDKFHYLPAAARGFVLGGDPA